MDEFAVWNSALSGADAAQVFQRGVLGIPVQGVSVAEGPPDQNANAHITATGWAVNTLAVTPGANNDLGDAGVNGHWMGTTGAGSNTLTITYTDLDPHTHVNLGMLVAQLDSLDPLRDDDRFIVRIDGRTILDVNNSFDDEIVLTGNAALDAELLSLRTAAGVQLFGDANFLENVYDLSQLSAFQMIPHSGSTLVLEIIGRQNQGSGEFYGVDNITLQLAVPEPISIWTWGIVGCVAVGWMCRRRR
jgi:hypothetical protein